MNICAIAYAAGYASGYMVDLAARLCYSIKACAVFKAFAGIDTHHCER